MRQLVVAALALAVLVPATALAGGWATVKLSSTPTGAKAGVPWVVQLTVLQHGQTPLAGVKPTVTIRKLAAVRSTTGNTVFAARPTGRTGVYRARVVFPSAGTWRFAVYDGFTQYGGARTHTFAPVKIASR